MASSPARTPNSSKFKLKFSLSRPTSPSVSSIASDAPKDVRPPSIRRKTSRSPLRVWQSHKSGGSQDLDYTDQAGGVVQTYYATQMRATPSPPLSQESWGGRTPTPYLAETSMHTRNRELIPTFPLTPGTPPQLREPPHVEDERNVEPSGNSLHTEHSAARPQMPFHQGCRPEMDPRSCETTLNSSPKGRRHGMIYSPRAMSQCMSPHHAREVHCAEDPPAEDKEINLEDYPWFIGRIIAGVNVKMDLRAQQGVYLMTERV